MPAATPLNPLNQIDLGLGGLGDALARQTKEDEDMRRKKLLGGGAGETAANRLGLGAINILGGGTNG